MQCQRASTFSSRQPQRRALAAPSTRRLPSKWQRKVSDVRQRKIMSDKAAFSPKKPGGRVHRYGPRRRTQNPQENKHTACCASTTNTSTTTTPSCIERLVIGGEDTNAVSTSRKQSSPKHLKIQPSPTKEPPPPRVYSADNEEIGPPLQRQDGDGSSHSDKEDDPEIEELSRLRCPSERTEVIAERESRRRSRQRRCADYPGLAFGSSIFSSDTLMKFSVIKNELHNILKSQLKRVSTYISASVMRYVR